MLTVKDVTLLKNTFRNVYVEKVVVDPTTMLVKFTKQNHKM